MKFEKISLEKFKVEKKGNINSFSKMELKDLISLKGGANVETGTGHGTDTDVYDDTTGPTADWHQTNNPSGVANDGLF